MVNAALPPEATGTAPRGLIAPCAPADAVMVKDVAPGVTLAHHELQRLPFAPVAPSSVLTRVLAYSSSPQSVMSSLGSTWALLKSPQRLRAEPKPLW